MLPKYGLMGRSNLLEQKMAVSAVQPISKLSKIPLTLLQKRTPLIDD